MVYSDVTCCAFVTVIEQRIPFRDIFLQPKTFFKYDHHQELHKQNI